MNEPIIRRRFQMTEFETNHNKYWQVELYRDGMMKTEWGRVGVVNKPSIKYHQNQASVERLIREKEKKGYTEVKLHVPETHIAVSKKKALSIKPEVQALVDMIFTEAGKQQQTYLKVGIEELSQGQIDDARKVLTKISEMKIAHEASGRYDMGEFSQMAQLYYTLVPTKLPAKISARAVVDDLLNTLTDQEERLNQLSAGIAGYKRRVVNQETGIEALGGVKIERIDHIEDEYYKVFNLITTTAGYHSMRLQHIFRIEIPGERQRYETNDFGKFHEELLIHGTNNYNLQFILGQPGGLIVPQIHSHGRYYGDGIYFANRSQKSMNYTHDTTGTRTLLLCRVALGKQWIQDGGCNSRREAPEGYHSLKSKYTPSGLDELIVYRPEQSTVSYLVTYK